MISPPPVEISLRVDDRGPPPAQATSGGLRITVGEQVLTRVANEEQFANTAPWSPAYVGTHLRMDLLNLSQVAVAVHDDEIDRYDVAYAEIEATPLSIAVERLSGQHLRLAFHTMAGPDENGPTVPVNAECGYLVTESAFRTAVVDAIREFIRTLASLGVNTDHHSLNGLRKATDTLRSNTTNTS